MYLIIGKESNQCNILKNLLDEKGIQYTYLDMGELPNRTNQYLKMYSSNYPIILKISHFSSFQDVLVILTNSDLLFFLLLAF